MSDRKLELVIGNLLRVGVLLAATITILGAIVYLSHHGGDGVSYHTFDGDASTLRSVVGVFKGVAALNGRAIIQLGVILLIATPVARVAFSAIAFLMERDYLYVVITLIVLAILLYSLFFGKALR